MCATNRFLTTHVGSRVRPPSLADVLRKIESGETYDEAAHERCLRESATEVVRQQIQHVGRAAIQRDIANLKADLSGGECGDGLWLEQIADLPRGHSPDACIRRSSGPS